MQKCVSLKGLMELLSTLRLSEVHTMRLHLPDHTVKAAGRLGDISILDASGNELLNVSFSRACQELPSKRAIHIQETVMPMEWYRKGERRSVSARVGSSLQIVVYQRVLVVWEKAVDCSNRSGLHTWMKR